MQNSQEEQTTRTRVRVWVRVSLGVIKRTYKRESEIKMLPRSVREIGRQSQGDSEGECG